MGLNQTRAEVEELLLAGSQEMYTNIDWKALGGDGEPITFSMPTDDGWVCDVTLHPDKITDYQWRRMTDEEAEFEAGLMRLAASLPDLPTPTEKN